MLKINNMITLNDVFLFRTKQIIESNGILTPIEFDRTLPFKPKRTFFVYGVPDLNPRGLHAHYKTKQILICLRGNITTTLHDGIHKKSYELLPGDSIFIPNLIWDEQIYHTSDTILLSLCSTHYNTADYIHDFNKFVNLKVNGK